VALAERAHGRKVHDGCSAVMLYPRHRTGCTNSAAAAGSSEDVLRYNCIAGVHILRLGPLSMTCGVFMITDSSLRLIVWRPCFVLGAFSGGFLSPSRHAVIVPRSRPRRLFIQLDRLDEH